MLEGAMEPKTVAEKVAKLGFPAVALTDRYDGPGLGESWNSHDRRSAFVGTFAVDAHAMAVNHSDAGE